MRGLALPALCMRLQPQLTVQADHRGELRRLVLQGEDVASRDIVLGRDWPPDGAARGAPDPLVLCGIGHQPAVDRHGHGLKGGLGGARRDHVPQDAVAGGHLGPPHRDACRGGWRRISARGRLQTACSSCCNAGHAPPSAPVMPRLTASWFSSLSSAAGSTLHSRSNWAQEVTASPALGCTSGCRALSNMAAPSSITSGDRFRRRSEAWSLMSVRLGTAPFWLRSAKSRLRRQGSSTVPSDRPRTFLLREMSCTEDALSRGHEPAGVQQVHQAPARRTSSSRVRSWPAASWMKRVSMRSPCTTTCPDCAVPSVL